MSSPSPRSGATSTLKKNPGSTAGQQRMPAVWEPHARTWLAWPAHPDTFAGILDAAQAAYAAVANRLSEFEPVVMVVAPEQEKSAQKRLSSAIERPIWPLNDAWMRDIAPSFIRTAGGGLAGVDWGFNDYGDKDGRGAAGYGDDAQIARRILAHLGLERIAAPILCEGGALVGDGAGTLVTTRSVVLNPNRNPRLNPAHAEALFKKLLGIRKTIWLSAGLQDDDTDGHADNLVAFVAPGRVLVLSENNPTDGNYPVLRECARRLETALDAAGRHLELVRLPQPRPRHGSGLRLVLSYVNYYLGNEVVLVPGYADPRHDADARAIIAEQFPGRRALTLPVLAIAAGGGGLHCIAHEEPLPCVS